MKNLIDRQMLNVLHLGIGCLVLFSANFTVTIMQKTINASITEDNPGYNVDGYITSSVIYMVYGIFLWLTPSFIAVTGSTVILSIGAATNIFYVFSMSLEVGYVTYIGVICGGVGGSFIWGGVGNYLIQNSDPKTVSRNVTTFWFLFSLAYIFGNLFVVFLLKGEIQIDKQTRHTMLYVLTAVETVGCSIFIFLGKPVRYTESELPEKEGALEAFKKTWHIFITKDMLILIISFFYAGVQHSFGNGIFQASVGFTQHFGNKAKQMVPLCGVIYGIGDSLCGLLNIFLPKIGLTLNRRSIIIVGCVVQIIGYCLTFINIPNDAVFGETSNSAIIEPNMWIALLCIFLIGLGDCCVNTQIFALLGVLQPNHGGQTCSLFKFSKSMATTAFFFISYYLGLRIQLLLLVVSGIAGTLAFSWVDIRSNKEKTNSFM